MKRTICLLILLVLLVPSISYCLHIETIPAVTERLRVKEGLVLTPYKDPGGDHYCIGYGHNLNFPICKEAAEVQLKHDIKMRILYLRSVFDDFDEFPLEKQIALIDLMFCMGPESFKTFKKMISSIQNKDWHQAGIEVLKSKWAKTYRTRAREISKDLMYGSVPISGKRKCSDCKK